MPDRVTDPLDGLGNTLRRITAYRDAPDKPYYEVWELTSDVQHRVGQFAERALIAAVRDPRTRPR